jgi:uncharacterized protein (AIM24 family)
MVQVPPVPGKAAVEGGAASSGAARGAERRFLEHLASAADLVAGRRFREAEVEVLRGLSIAASDVRALKLLALVRFKLGRLEEARAVCRELAATLPRDAGIRLKLGLIALKLNQVDESVHELEISSRLAPDDARVWSYLGFAYAQQGDRSRAAAAFRRAGEEEHAREAERGDVSVVGAPGGFPDPPARSSGRPGRPSLDARGTSHDGDGDDEQLVVAEAAAAAVASVAYEPAFDLSAPLALREPRQTGTNSDGLDPSPPTGAGVLPAVQLAAFAVSRLVPASEQASWVGATARLLVTPEAEVFVRQDAAVACLGAVTWQEAHRHVRGRDSGVPLGSPGAAGAAGAAFLRIQGRGELFVGAAGGRLVPLSLDGDTLYLREDRVLAFDGGLAWESGAVPRAGLCMLQFRGRGLVALAASDEPAAVRVAPDRPVFVSRDALLGWVGNIVALGDAGEGAVGAGPFAITCEGEGVVLMDVGRRSDKEGP